jgi:hypothetical protein
MPKEAFFLSREALYIKVWEKPTVKLAKEFGVSDVAIAKMCRRLEVPKPPLGYWRRVETGHKKKIPPLRKASEKAKPGVWIYPKSEEQTLQFEDTYKKISQVIEENLSEKISSESLPENKITVAATLHKPHPLIDQTRKSFSNGGVDMYGALHGNWNEDHINLRISKKHLNRALRIMDALFKSLEKRGCKPLISRDRERKTKIQVAEVNVEITLREDFKRFERGLSKDEKKSVYASDRHYYEPSGNLTFSINDYVGSQRNWRDGKNILLEDQLNDIVLGIFRAAEELRQKELERKKAERERIEFALKREKENIFYKREVECREAFTELLGKWQKSQTILHFIRTYEEKLIAENGTIDANSEEALLIEWAKDYAKRLDPIKSNYFNNLIEKILHRLDEPTEKDSYEYSNLQWKLKNL